MVLSNAVEIRKESENNKGCGLFASREIGIGEVVWWWDRTSEPQVTFTRDDILNHPVHSATLARYSYMIDHDTYCSTIDPDSDPSFYFNHSCDPNCWFDGDSLITKRIVHVGEELHYDYSLTETEISFHAGLKCKCGADICRGLLKFREYRSRQWVRDNAEHCASWIQLKIKEMGYLSPKCYLRRDVEYNCYGIKSFQSISKGEVVLVFAGKVVTLEELLELPMAERHLTLQVADNLWQVPIQKEASDYVNHSCDPNCGLIDSTTLVAMRDILPEEEITIEYATVNSGAIGTDVETDNFECYCGSANCRQWISATDWMITELQERLAGYWPQYMQKLIDQYRSERKLRYKNDSARANAKQPAPIMLQKPSLQSD